MENNVTPGLDTPSTRILIGLLIGVVLTAGAFIGGFIALSDGPAKPSAVTAEAAKGPEAVKLEVWNLAAGRNIAPVLNAFAAITAEDQRKACDIVSPERLDALRAVSTAPNATIDDMYRLWITDLEALRAECSNGGSEADISQQMATSGATFNAFFAAVNAVIGKPLEANQQIPSAVSRGGAPAGSGPEAGATPSPSATADKP